MREIGTMFWDIISSHSSAVSHRAQFGDSASPVGDVDESAGGCASLNEMIHLQWETTASPNFGICDTTFILEEFFQIRKYDGALFHRLYV
jgi:hypothetical protein